MTTIEELLDKVAITELIHRIEAEVCPTRLPLKNATLERR
jgi:hypothetical protein